MPEGLAGEVSASLARWRHVGGRDDGGGVSGLVVVGKKTVAFPKDGMLEQRENKSGKLFLRNEKWFVSA